VPPWCFLVGQQPAPHPRRPPPSDSNHLPIAARSPRKKPARRTTWRPMPMEGRPWSAGRRGGTWAWQTTTEDPRQSTAGLNCSCARTGVQIEPGTARCRAHVPTPRQAPLPQFPVLVLPPVSHLNHARLQQSGFVGVTLESNFVANRSLATGSFFSSFPISFPFYPQFRMKQPISEKRGTKPSNPSTLAPCVFRGRAA
jgi:hypothetical protein